MKPPTPVNSGTAPAPPPGATGSSPRLLFIDNVRWAMIVLVISMHAADTYSPLGNWYFVDRTPLTPAALLAFAAWQVYLQSFFMGLLFFIAGFFVPASFDRKGPWRFVRERAFRLGLPVLFYMFVLGPVTEYFVAHSWSAQHSTFAREWWHHIADWEFLSGNGPLWFCLALLIFSAAYAALRVSRPSAMGGKKDSAPPATGSLVRFALAMAVLTFLIRLVQPSGSSFLNMQLGDFSQYILLFAAGIAAAGGGWMPKLPFRAGMRWLTVTLPVGFAVWLTVVIAGGALTGNVAAYSGGWHWQSAAINLWEAFTCVAMCFGLLVLFREKFNRQGRLAKFLSANAFSVYVFHPPLLIMGARLLHALHWHPLLKFAALTAIAGVTSFALSAAVFRRIPLLRRIL